MKLSIEIIRAISIGAVEVEEKENGFSFHRFTKLESWTKPIRERVEGKNQAWVHTGILIVKRLCIGDTSECSMIKV